MAASSVPDFVKDPDILAHLIAYAAKGIRPRDAGRKVGININTWNKWWARGKRDDSAGDRTPYGQLYRQVQGAYEDFIDEVETVFFEKFLSEDSPKRDWRVFAWFLSRSRPDRWGDQAASGSGELDEGAQGFVDRVVAGEADREDDADGGSGGV